MDQRPEFCERVLDRRCRQQHDRDVAGADGPEDAIGHHGLRSALSICALAIEAPPDTCEDLVGLIDDAQIERPGVAERLSAALTAGGLSSEKEDTVARQGLWCWSTFDRFDAEQ